MSIDVLKRETDNVKHFLQEYRDDGLPSAQTDAREIAEKMQIDMTFPVARQRRTTRMFLYEGKEELGSHQRDTSSKIFFFLCLIQHLLVLVRGSHKLTTFFLYSDFYIRWIT